MVEFDTYEVGGCVRDKLLGLPTKDIDFVMVPQGGLLGTSEGMVVMRRHLEAEGFEIHVETPDKFVIRCGIPEGHPLRGRAKDADFVLARKDGPYSDGRRPDWVMPGTLEDDLSRRDFTVNAMAEEPLTGALIDPHGGREDLENRLLRFVGAAEDRIMEDGVRVMRAFRFMITKGFQPTPMTSIALTSEYAADMLGRQARELVRDELVRCFRHDTLASLDLLGQLPGHTRRAIFRDGLRLDATLAQ